MYINRNGEHVMNSHWLISGRPLPVPRQGDFKITLPSGYSPHLRGEFKASLMAEVIIECWLHDKWFALASADFTSLLDTLRLHSPGIYYLRATPSKVGTVPKLTYVNPEFIRPVNIPGLMHVAINCSGLHWPLRLDRIGHRGNEVQLSRRPGGNDAWEFVGAFNLSDCQGSLFVRIADALQFDFIRSLYIRPYDRGRAMLLETLPPAEQWTARPTIDLPTMEEFGTWR